MIISNKRKQNKFPKLRKSKKLIFLSSIKYIDCIDSDSNINFLLTFDFFFTYDQSSIEFNPLIVLQMIIDKKS